MASLQKIDIHNSKMKFLRARERFLLDETLSQRNRELIVSFLNDCALGKTVKKRQKKKIQERRLFKYLYHLRMVARNQNKDFDKLEMKDMEQFISKLETGSLEVVGRQGKSNPGPYSPNTQRDIKIALRKFYKWLWGNCENDPEIVAWFDTSIPEPEVNALSEEEIVRMVDFAPTIMQKALIWALYETGARSEEFINIRLGHLTEKDTHFVAQIEFPKTFKRSPPIYEGPFRAKNFSYLKQWLRQHPHQDDPTAQVFKVSYRALNKWIREIGKRALNKHVTPHLLRDSRATYLARKKVGRYQMCKLMGWSMSSRMPDRYIDRAGVAEEETLEAIRRDDMAKSEEENLQLKRRLLELEQQSKALEGVSEARGKADDVMTRLMGDKEVQRVLVRKLRELDLAGTVLDM